MRKVVKKLRPVIIPFLFFILVFSVLTSQNLDKELELPAEGWSRSLPLNTGVIDEVKPVVFEENGKQHVFVPNENEVMSFVVNRDLKVENKRTVPVSIPSPQYFYVKNNDYVFVRNKQLIHFDGKQEHVLDQDVFGMHANDKKIIYFKEHEILSVEPGSWIIKSISTVKERLRSVILNDQSESFLSVGTIKGNTKAVKANFYQLNGSAYTKHTILDKEELISENHFGFYFIENGKDLTVYYTLFTSYSGGKSYNAYYETKNLESNTDWKFNKMTFVDKNGVILENPKYIEYGIDKNNKAKILFTTRAMKSLEKEAVNVYEAKQQGDVWLTERRSTTNHAALHPAWINAESIIWMNLVGFKQFTFSGASTNPDIIEKSLVRTKEDVKQAVSTTILSLFQGMVLAMSALYWITPAVLFALVIYLLKINLMENEDKRVMYTILALYLVVQIIFIQKLFNSHYYLFAPDFISFSGSSIVIPLLLALFSGIAVLFGKKRDWGMLTSLCYFVAVNTLFLSLTVGPYMF